MSAQGFYGAGRVCTWHRIGVPPNAGPFFVKDCPRCEAKKAAGLVRGDEGGPPPSSRVTRPYASRNVPPPRRRARPA